MSTIATTSLLSIQGSGKTPSGLMHGVLMATLVCSLIGFQGAALATTYYVDPVNGSDSGDGSSEHPWQSLQGLFDDGLIESQIWDSLPYTATSTLVPKNQGAPIQAGDVIALRSGNYDTLTLTGYYNAKDITIQADQGHTPVFRDIRLRSARNWTLAGLQVDASAYAAADFSNLISLESHSWTGPIDHITVRNCRLQSTADSSSWSRDDWNTLAKSGLRVGGSEMTISNNILFNVNFGISVGATHSLIEYNQIVNFAGDGLRGLGDYTTFQYNTVKNCYDVNDNHDDGFQSWSVGADGKVGTGVVRGIVLRKNTIINYEDENQPFLGSLQGIGCFDGMFDGWLVEGNRIEVDNWHGITFLGGTNMVIRKNIVTDPNGTANYGPPWIMLGAHKNGTPSADSRLTCNVSPKLRLSDDDSIVSQYNVLTNDGGPLDPHCRTSLTNTLLVPLLIDDDRDH